MHPRVLYIEPFNSGSHAAFTKTLTESDLPIDWVCLTLPGRHWKWRMRGSAIWWASPANLPDLSHIDLIFTSSFFPLAEFKGLLPQLSQTPSILYFHENQLAYPSDSKSEHHQIHQDRDHHYGFSQLVSASAATRCLFNSRYNLESFYQRARDLLRRMPDFRPADWIDTLETKSFVLPLPLELDERSFNDSNTCSKQADSIKGPLILWNHRWEHDKDPESFFEVLFELSEQKLPFRLAVCGETFRKYPPIFDRAQTQLTSHIVHWGYVKTRTEYLNLIRQADIAVSTARHEFFGISMLEACQAGATPLVPHRLAYPEIFPTDNCYRSRADLQRRLAKLCENWTPLTNEQRAKNRKLSSKFGAKRMLPEYFKHIEALSKLKA